MRARILLASLLVTCAALPAAGQSVKVSFSGGKVNLSAENATLRAILTEWGRVGGTRVVNAERIAGPPITVEFKDTYEQQALESLLRGVAGYMVGQRGPAGAATSSGFDRIVILASSNAPRPTPVTPAVSRPPGPQPLRRLPVPVEEDQNNDDNDNEPPPAPASTPANPFGITTGAARPGVITPVPAARPQQARPTPDPASQQ